MPLHGRIGGGSRLGKVARLSSDSMGAVLFWELLGGQVGSVTEV